MTLKEKLQIAWENRSKIAEGLYNTYISHDADIKTEAARRLSLCKENLCGFWDEGTNSRLMVKGKGGCILCRCEGEYKTHCMSCHCSLKDIGEEPRWEALLTKEQDDNIKQITYDNQFKNKGDGSNQTTQ